MAEKSYSTIQQHPPLRVPTGWSSEEKALIIQLEEILDDLYNRFGYMRFKDKGKTIDIDNINAKTVTADQIICPASIPNIVTGKDEPEPGHNTIWLEPETGGGGSVDYTDTRTVAAAASNSCPERVRPTFTYTVSLNSPLDLTDATSLTFAGTMYRKGNDYGQTFTVYAKLKFSDGTYMSLGTVGSGRTMRSYPLSASANVSSVSKTVVGVVYTVKVEDNFGYMCSFYAGTINVAGKHPSQEPSDIVTVHYIP